MPVTMARFIRRRIGILLLGSRRWKGTRGLAIGEVKNMLKKRVKPHPHSLSSWPFSTLSLKEVVL